MEELFEVSAGTITGKLHVMTGKNNQDAFHTIYSDDFLVGIVSDGCGSEPHSEIGSQLGCRMLAEIISKRMKLFQNSGLDIKEILNIKFWENAGQDICAQLKIVAEKIDTNLEEVVKNFFLFTLVGFIITRNESLFFSLGDGIIIINGETKILGPFPDNAPPYLGYNILNTGRKKPMNQIIIQKVVDTNRIESLLIGTDGIEYLIKSRDEKIPGKNEVVGPISQFWKENCFFQNQDMIRRKLTLINRTHVKLDKDANCLIKEHGHLPDDTTLIVVRRKMTNVTE